jgi:hypothetical protein
MSDPHNAYDKERIGYWQLASSLRRQVADASRGEDKQQMPSAVCLSHPATWSDVGL